MYELLLRAQTDRYLRRAEQERRDRQAGSPAGGRRHARSQNERL